MPLSIIIFIILSLSCPLQKASQFEEFHQVHCTGNAPLDAELAALAHGYAGLIDNYAHIEVPSQLLANIMGSKGDASDIAHIVVDDYLELYNREMGAAFLRFFAGYSRHTHSKPYDARGFKQYVPKSWQESSVRTGALTNMILDKIEDLVAGGYIKDSPSTITLGGAAPGDTDTEQRQYIHLSTFRVPTPNIQSLGKRLDGKINYILKKRGWRIDETSNELRIIWPRPDMSPIEPHGMWCDKGHEYYLVNAVYAHKDDDRRTLVIARGKEKSLFRAIHSAPYDGQWVSLTSPEPTTSHLSQMPSSEFYRLISTGKQQGQWLPEVLYYRKYKSHPDKLRGHSHQLLQELSHVHRSHDKELESTNRSFDNLVAENRRLKDNMQTLEQLKQDVEIVKLRLRLLEVDREISQLKLTSIATNLALLKQKFQKK